MNVHVKTYIIDVLTY